MGMHERHVTADPWPQPVELKNDPRIVTRQHFSQRIEGAFQAYINNLQNSGSLYKATIDVDGFKIEFDEESLENSSFKCANPVYNKV